MQLDIVQAESDSHRQEIRALFEEYLSSMAPLFMQEFGISLDVSPYLERSMSELHKFMPPHGCLLLAYAGDQLAGCACLRRLADEIGELKRMFVRPQHRNQSIGRHLVAAIIAQAQAAGYARLRLDSAGFLLAAHHLYESSGFTPIAPYAGSECPEELRPYFRFMELQLGAPEGGRPPEIAEPDHPAR